MRRVGRRPIRGTHGNRLELQLPPTRPAPLVERNSRLLILDAVGGSVLNAAIAFNAVYAVRLGATNAEVGLLASLPSLLAVLVTLPVGRYLESLRSLLPFATATLGLHRVGYLLLVLVPFAPADVRPTALVALVVLASIPLTGFGVALNTLYGDLLPDKRRSAVLSWRMIALSVGALVVTPVAGVWLDRVAFPSNYQALYLFAALWGLMSVIAIRELRYDGEPPLRRSADGSSLLTRPIQTLRSFAGEVGFWRITLDTFVHGMGVWLAAPLYVLLYVREMGATDGWFGLFTAVSAGAQAVGYYLWQRGVLRWGDRRVLIGCVTASGFFPLLVGIAPSLDVVMGIGVAYGLVVPGLGLSHFPTLIRVCPADRRPTFIALYTMLMNAGAAVAPLLSVAAIGVVGLRPMLVLAGALWASSGLFFWRLPPEPALPGEAHESATASG